MGDTLTTSGLLGARVESSKKPGKRVGRVRHIIFHPNEKRVVGFAVKRPDAALMFHRSNIFVALDGFYVVDGTVVISNDPSATDRGAEKRLGFKWDDCVIWQGLPIMTKNEERLGYVGEVSFDPSTGQVISVKVDKGVSADFLLGESELPVDLIDGFKIGIGDNLSKVSEDDFFRGALVVKPGALSLERRGGAAEKAGAGVSVAAHKVSEVADKVKPKANEAAQKAGDAVNKGAFKLGEQLSKTRGMFSSFKEEYKIAAGGGSDDDQ